MNKNARRLLGSLVVSVGAVAGCSGGSPAGSCFETGVINTGITQGGATTLCADYVSGYSVSEAMSLCAASASGVSGATSTYSAGACTATGRVGRCQLVSSNTGGVYTESFYTGDATMLMNACLAADGLGQTATWLPN